MSTISASELEEGFEEKLQGAKVQDTGVVNAAHLLPCWGRE
jgi:hypothetical protein